MNSKSLFHTCFCRLGCLLTLFLAALNLQAAGTDPGKAGRPNVLFIAVDDLRDWVAFLGNNQAKTPNFDRLAARGVHFTRAYCAAPVCNPSRTAVLSGMRPSTTGVYDNGNDWRQVISNDKTLTHYLMQHGYHVAGAGKIYHGKFPQQEVWHEWDTTRENDPKPKPEEHLKYGGNQIVLGPVDAPESEFWDYNAATVTINQLQKRHDKPFFLACGFYKPHLPFYVPAKYFEMYPLDQIKLPPTREDDLDDIPPDGLKLIRRDLHDQIVKSDGVKRVIQAYLACISFVDMNLGRVLDALDQSDYKDNTIVCLWSDHGFHLGEKQHWRKHTLWEEATRSVLIYAAPGITKPGTVSHATVDLMSIYPTLMDLCGLPIPSHVQGESIHKLLENPDAKWEKPAITTEGANTHSIRSADWRYIRYADGSEELYDKNKDPHEWTNLAQDPKLATVKQELASWLPKENVPPSPSPKKTKAPTAGAGTGE
jgi:iduronate 2-sulfatase